MKGKKTDLGSARCAVARTLNVIGDWWTLLIVRDALFGKQRFGEFQKSIGLAKNILSSRLKKLVQDGIFEVEADPDSAAVRRYVLTERGKRLAIVIAAMWQWGEENCFPPEEPAFGLAEKTSGGLLAKLELKTVEGHSVMPGHLQMVIKPRCKSRRGGGTGTKRRTPSE